MDETTVQSRLSRIQTQWTLIRQAHVTEPDSAASAQAALLERYQGAVYRYLVAVLRNADAADEVFQDFAVCFLKGDLRAANPERGKFRAYLKTILLRMISNYRRRRHRRQEGAELAEVERNVEQASSFEEGWQRELLRKTWEALAAHEQDTRQPYYSALRLRAEFADASSEELAAKLTQRLGAERPCTAATFRKQLQRAREKFAELLFEEVASSLQTREFDAVEEELICLNLHSYCRSALKRLRP